VTIKGLTLAGIRRRRDTPCAGIVLAILALCLRLALPVSMPAPPQFDAAAALGEHALCLSGDRAAVPREAPRAPPGEHAEHNGLGCCLWHVATAFLLPRIDPPLRPAFAASLPAVAAPAATAPSRTAGLVQARGPPTGV
jgi:hypothetical protein